jgi:hypothetical protein
MLWVTLVVAIGVSRRRPFRVLSGESQRRIRLFGFIALGTQTLHFLEELLGGFQEVFPTLFGLAPFSRTSFVVFNVSWLLIWLIAIPAAAGGRRFAEWPLWFLAFALVLNGVAHPILALGTRGYFPGLITTPLVAVGGFLFLRCLLRLTRGSAAGI